jgi:tetratricopeptide (TPR) repeat protein
VLSAARTSSHEHADCGESHYLIGDILHRSGKFAEALDEFENALRIRKNVYGEMSLQVADVYESKTMIFFKLEKWREAVTFGEATIHIRTVLLGADDASLVNLKTVLAAAEMKTMLVAAEEQLAASERTK